MIPEEWKAIPRFEGLYDVSSLGRVRRSPIAPNANASRQGRIIGGCKPDSRTGYMRVSLRKGGMLYRFQVHRLVAGAFMDPAKPCMHVNHKDGDKTNNRLENLEWATPQENVRHAWATGLCHALKGADHPAATLSEESVKTILSAVVRGVPHNIIAKVMNVSATTVGQISSGSSWGHIHKGKHVS